MCASALHWPPAVQGRRVRTHPTEGKSPFRGEVKMQRQCWGEMTLSWSSSWKLSGKMQEDGPHSRRNTSWKGTADVFPSGSAQAWQSPTPGRDLRRSEMETRLARTGAPWPHEDQRALLPVVRVFSSSVSAGITDGLQARTSPSFPGIEVINQEQLLSCA